MSDAHIVYRPRLTDAGDHETALARALFRIMEHGDHDLGAIVAALEASDVRPAGGGTWTEATFRAEMKRLGTGPATGPVAAVRT